MLTSKQRATLRGIASTYETIFQVGKGGISDTLVPAGETYRAVYTTDASAASILAQYSTVTFTAALADGVQAVYYVVPAESAESVSAALSEAGISCSAYTEDPSVLSSASEALLYILLD